MDVRKIAHAIGAAPPTVIGNEELIKPTKAYKNSAFLASSNAKSIRVLTEMMETETRMAGSGINKTILFFGSARSRSPEEHAAAVASAQSMLNSPNPDEVRKAAQLIKRLEATRWMVDVYPRIEELAARLTKWSMSRMGSDGRMPYAVSTGGGPGLMEAANKGAASVDGALNVGCGISLPFEVGLNKYVTPELAFEYHYFFVRKFSMCYWCRAFVVAPGGYGTCDELFEILTLLQTGKIDLPDLMPVVLFGRDFWRRIVDWQALVDLGTISQADVDRLLFTDSVEEAFEHITGKLLAWETASAQAAVDANKAAQVDRARLSAAAQAHLKTSEAVMAAAATGISLPGTAVEGGAAAPGALLSTSGGRARRASFHGPPVPTPGGTLDSEVPASADIASPPAAAARASTSK